jgi:hypothetical protein
MCVIRSHAEKNPRGDRAAEERLGGVGSDSDK